MSVSEYCVDDQEAEGVHRVHNLSLCHDLHLPAPDNRISLGHHYSFGLALQKARKLFQNIAPCAFCHMKKARQ